MTAGQKTLVKNFLKNCIVDIDSAVFLLYYITTPPWGVRRKLFFVSRKKST